MVTFNADKVRFIFILDKVARLNIVQGIDLRVDFGVRNSRQRKDFGRVGAGVGLEVTVKVSQIISLRGV